MRRLVRDYVAAALDRQGTDIEHFVAARLEYPDAFPLYLAEPTASIHEVCRITIAPRYRADYPPIDVTAVMKVLVTALAVRREVARGVRTAAVPEDLLGRRTFKLDVELVAFGAPAANGYGLEPRTARLVGWCGVAQSQ